MRSSSRRTVAWASCQPGRPVSIAAKRPPPTRAAIDIEGPAAERRTSSERRPEMSRCATCCRTEFARARPRRLFTTTRCSMSKRATATWLVSEAVTSAFSSACSSRSPSGRPVRASKWSGPALLPLLLDRLAQALHLRAHARRARPSVSARRTRRSARTERDVPVEGALQEVGRPRFRAALASRGPGAEGEDGNARPGGLMSEDFAEAAAAIVAQRHVREHDDRAVAAGLIDVLRPRRPP
mgnify:CR=1 FL=1